MDQADLESETALRRQASDLHLQQSTGRTQGKVEQQAADVRGLRWSFPVSFLLFIINMLISSWFFIHRPPRREHRFPDLCKKVVSRHAPVLQEKKEVQLM